MDSRLGEEPGACAAQAPLQGLTVVEIGHSVAAPFAGQVLADLGARVLKVENPQRGDDARGWGPPFWNGMATVFQSVNRNKLSTAIDLKNPVERDTLASFIVEEADIVVQNMRAGLLANLGLDAASLRARNPRLIYCNLGAFGATGPLAGRPGYDPLMQAFGGIMSVTGNEGEPPVRVGVSIVDQGAGMWAVIGVLAALQRRHATGLGCEVDTSLFETALSWIGAASAGYQATGRIPPRRGSENPSLVPYKVFQASDGDLVIAAGNDNLFRKLAHALGRPDWLDDERFATNPARVMNRVVVNEAVQAMVGARSRAEICALLDQVDVPVAPLQSVDQVLAHPQTQALDMFQQSPDADLRLMGSPLSFDGKRPQFRSLPPELGADTAAIMGPRDAKT